MRTRTVFVAVVALGAVALAGCGHPHAKSAPGAAPAPATAPSHGVASVVLFGDSLSSQAAPDFDRLVMAGGATVANYVYGGTAACDWLSTMRKVAASAPRAAVLEFVGTTFAACMQGCPPESASAVTKYCGDVASAIAAFAAAGSHVFLEGTPITRGQSVADDPHWDDLNRAFQALAAKDPSWVTYVDAGRAVEGDGGSFTWTLPCMATEPCLGPTVDGVPSNTVRAPDGVHFCQGVGTTLGCPTYSSGAYRFAAAMARPVVEYLQSSRNAKAAPAS